MRTRPSCFGLVLEAKQRGTGRQKGDDEAFLNTLESLVSKATSEGNKHDLVSPQWSAA